MIKRVILIVLLLIANEVNCQKLDEGILALSKSDLFYQNKDMDSAYYYANKALNTFEIIRNDSLCLKSLILLIDITVKTKIEENDKYLDLAEKKAQATQNWEFLSIAYLKRANTYYSAFKDDLAIQYYLKIDSLLEMQRMETPTRVSALVNVGQLMLPPDGEKDTLKYSKAKNYILEAVRIADNIDSPASKALAYQRYASLLFRLGKYNQSNVYLKKVLPVTLAKNDIIRTSEIYWTIAANKKALQEIDSAEYYYQERIKILEEAQLLDYLALAYSGIGGFYNQTNRFQKGVSYHQKALDLFKSSKSQQQGQVLGTLNGLASSYFGIKDYRRAYETLDRAYLMNDTLMAKRNKDISLELEAKYQTEKKLQEINLLSAKNKVVEKEKSNQRNIFLALFGLSVILVGFMFLGYRNKIKTASKLKDLDELKSRFFANISHEFRTPLTLIKSPLQQLQHQDVSEEHKKNLDLIEQNSNRMLTLVDQLLELSKLDAKRLKPIFKEVDISSFLESLTESFAFEAKTQSIQFESNIQQGKCFYDKDIIEKIVSNLLSNALKYTAEGHKISFNASIEKERLHLSVSNSGVNLKPSELNRLFERFYQHNESDQGAGIGLALVKELVTLYKGELSTTLNDGVLTFNVELPIDVEQLKKIGIVSQAIKENDVILSDGLNTEELPVLLLADDNADIRMVLKDIFKSDFHVFEAKDGKEALEIALKEVPEIIITDVMMPKMDGFELCKSLKKNEVTSFIPIILLTAKTGDESHLKGLQNQADAFITKPFNHDILNKKVHQLLGERRKLRERYSRELVLRPKDIFIDSVDEKFIVRLQAILDKHLSNSDFTAEQFASEAYMSRMQLHRKLKALLGFSAMGFLRHERLKAAALLLQKGKITISEVAYSVGFNDVDYFSKCFKETYLVTPSEYLSKDS